MSKKIVLIIVAFLVLIICWQVWQKYVGQTLHQPITIDEVTKISIWGEGIPEGHMGREATIKEKENIITWFNSVTDIRQNKGLAGTTPPAGIVIELKSGKRFLILDSGTDFEFQRSTRNGTLSYWGKQAQLDDFLSQLSK